MPKIIHGTTHDEMFESIEVILKQFQRRLSTKVIGMLSPVPLLHRQACSDPNGEFFAAVCPLHGTCVRVCIRVEQYTVSRPLCKFVHASGTTVTQVDYVMQHVPVEVITLDERIIAGDLIKLVIDPPGSISGILVGILVIPDVVGQVRQEHYLLNQFLTLEEQENAEPLP